MESFAVILSAAAFLIWLIQAADLIWGVLFSMPSAKPHGLPYSGPKISVIFAARDEGPKVAETVAALLLQDYPDFEIIAVDDRSTDGTASALEAFKNEKRLKVIRIENLPDGWLGKNHALFQGTRAASGEWLLFTDADVIFHRQALSRAAEEAEKYRLDHLVLIPELVYREWIEAVFSSAFGMAFFRRFRIWAARDPKSKAYVGMGAFNFIKRGAYEKIGTHQKIAFDILDDMDLGKLVKESGFRQMAIFAKDLLKVRWVESVSGVIRSIEKNAFAGLGYNVFGVIFVTAACLLADVLPFLFLFYAEGPALYFASAAVGLIFASYAVCMKNNSLTLYTFPFHPIGSILLLALIWRSALITLVQGGVRWRGTFYSLKELKKSQVTGYKSQARK